MARATNLTLWCVLLGAGLWAWPAGSAQAATGTLQDVQHVVVLTLENRSFDQYYGSYPGVCGFSDQQALVLRDGNPAFCQSHETNHVLPFQPDSQCVSDVAHDFWTEHGAWSRGNWDGWLSNKGAPSMIYYTRSDIPFYYGLADAYTLCDAYHCSVMGPTYPNRLYQMTGTIDPDGTDGGPVTGNSVPPGGYTWTTYAERLQTAGVSWRVYQQRNDFFALNPLAWFANFKNSQPGDPLYDQGLALVSNVVGEFRADVTNGVLPKVCWVMPPWSESEHPDFTPASGNLLVKGLLEALMANPEVYNSTVFLVTYDEGGGFFDHVPPPSPPPDTPGEFIYRPAICLGPGVRVPLLVISPWSCGGYVCSQVFDHTSLLQFLEKCTGVPEPNISAWRRQVCGDLTSAFDFTTPNTNYPSLPAPIPHYCSGDITPVPPAVQSMPAQEPAVRFVRPLPYQPDAVSAADCATGSLTVTLTNSGAASVHFAIHPNGPSAEGPWHYDVPETSATTAVFNTGTNGSYDYTSYGPNRFLRRFAGTILSNCAQVELSSSIDPAAAGITLVMMNSTEAPVTFTVTNSYALGDSSTLDALAGQTVTYFYSAVASTSGWYDLTVTASNVPGFLRRLAGHIETGTVTTSPPLVLPPVSKGVISVALVGQDLVLSYPLWAATNTLVTSTDLASANWTVVTNPPTVGSNNIQLVVPLTPDRAFFRFQP